MRLVSVRRKVGKTSLGTELLKELISRGVKVAVIKHVHQGLKLEGDSGRYLSSGADYVVVSSSDLVIKYSRPGGKSLKELISELPSKYSVVIAEGFKSEELGDAVLVVKDLSEVKDGLRIVKGEVVATYLSSSLSSGGLSELGIKLVGNARELSELVIERAIKYLSNQLPKLNCGLCGFSSCEDLAKAYLVGLNVWCPRLLNVELVVNGSEVPLVPFVKDLIARSLLGMVTSLKGVPKEFREVKELVIKVKL